MLLFSKQTAVYISCTYNNMFLPINKRYLSSYFKKKRFGNHFKKINIITSRNSVKIYLKLDFLKYTIYL